MIAYIFRLPHTGCQVSSKLEVDAFTTSKPSSRFSLLFSSSPNLLGLMTGISLYTMAYVGIPLSAKLKFRDTVPDGEEMPSAFATKAERSKPIPKKIFSYLINVLFTYYLLSLTILHS